ncbi:MAG: arginine repressor, partial [Clostridiales bacterium]|nr:arginine repressor [Clostridiales bacterium]
MKTDKNSRQERILSLIRDNDISTQEDLTAKVNQAGFEATQATISRDIKELGIIK